MAFSVSALSHASLTLNFKYFKLLHPLTIACKKADLLAVFYMLTQRGRTIVTKSVFHFFPFFFKKRKNPAYVTK